MGFRFLHTADWQLGKTFGSFDVETSHRLQEARFEMIDRVAQAARSAEVSHVLVAGDVFDHRYPTQKVLSRSVDRLAQAQDLTWWLLPGNHDPAGTDSLWDRLISAGLPANVRPLTQTVPAEAEDGIWLLPAPWTTKHPGRDLTEAFQGMQTPSGVRIGLAHGGVEAFGSDPDHRQIIAQDRAATANLAYLALGDWHGARRAGLRAWYPGTPEADSFTNNDRGRVLIVDTDRPDEPNLVSVGQFQWESRVLELDAHGDLDATLNGLFPEGKRLDMQLLKLRLKGQIGLVERARLEARIETERSRLAFFELEDDDLNIIVDPASWQAMLGDGALTHVAKTFAHEAEQGDDVAEEALRLLSALAQR